MTRSVYLDYNATSPLKPRVKAAVERYLAEGGNPSSIHAPGRRARAAVDAARDEVAAFIGVKPAAVVFTSGGTEANNQALRAVKAAAIVISAVEHDSVIGAAYAAGVPVVEVPVDGDGLVRFDALKEALAKAPKPALVSLMLANNETGVIQPVREAADIARGFGAVVHCDAIQAAGKIPLDFNELGVDLMSLSAHKLSGLPGAGALIFRPGFNLPPLIFGGGQEQGYRSGTENVAGIVSLGAAAREAKFDFGKNSKIKELRDNLETKIKSYSNRVKVFGGGTDRLPNTSCLVMPGVLSETQVMAFDLQGICVSSGSACSSGKVKTSHVLKAMGAPKAEADCMIRVSLGWGTTRDDIEAFIEAWQRLFRHAGDGARA